MLLGGLEYDELLPLWAKRVKVILMPPPLFESIKLARTERGVTWNANETAKLVAADNGLVAVATGTDTTYTVLDRGSKLQGALSALFGKMWDYPPLCDILEGRNRFMLIATTIKAIYDHTARKMELQARLVVAQDGKHVHVKHNCGDSPTYLQQHPELAQAATKRQRTQHCSLPPSRAPRAEPTLAPMPSQAAPQRRDVRILPLMRKGRPGAGKAGDHGVPMARTKAGTRTGQANGPGTTEVECLHGP